ncbi:MAG: 2-phosphosulfolactate phosphatase family protein [Oscillatoriales cyanobacterium SM2_2_1]|nr:2-phosphosulfolactate phosphatase family protein [Oscillatoriales cyanobacterium SM2_2_1]
MKLSVYHTPELVPADGLPDCAIAVDVLRATTTIATALSAGAEAIQVFADLNELWQVSGAFPESQRLRAGERGGKKVEGYDLGNSPFDYTASVVRGKRIFMSTTNGTRTLQRIRHSPMVLTGAMVNLGAVVEFLTQKQPRTVWVVGSGWEGSYALEDTACAGAIAHGLAAELGNDEAVAALTLYRHWCDDLETLFHHASHGQRLLKLNGWDDIAYCAQRDVVSVVPCQNMEGVLTAIAG